MPVYAFVCPRDHVEDRILPFSKADSPQVCSTCGKAQTRKLVPFGISGEHTGHQMYQSEQEAWALATGEKHRTAGELDSWARQNGKSILNKGEKVKPVDNLPSEREVEVALDRIHTENYKIGDVT